jgi:hypothetical protein
MTGMKLNLCHELIQNGLKMKEVIAATFSNTCEISVFSEIVMAGCINWPLIDNTLCQPSALTNCKNESEILYSHGSGDCGLLGCDAV